jgi:hypothetical protein
MHHEHGAGHAARVNVVSTAPPFAYVTMMLSCFCGSSFERSPQTGQVRRKTSVPSRRSITSRLRLSPW